MKHYGQRIEVKPQIATSSTKLQRIHTLRNLPDRVLHQKYHKIQGGIDIPTLRKVEEYQSDASATRSNSHPQDVTPHIHCMAVPFSTSAAPYVDKVLGYYGLDPCGKECFCHRKYKGMQNQAVHQWHRMMQSDNSRLLCSMIYQFL